MPARVPNQGWLTEAVGEVSESPYPSNTVVEKVFSNRSRTTTGRDAPPETQSRSSGSASARGAASSSWTYIVGTPKNSVARSRCIRSMAAAGSNRGCSSRVAPTRNVEFIDTVWPKVWNSGRQPITTSSRRIGFASNAFTVEFSTRLRCVSRAPFGRPVVPLV